MENRCVCCGEHIPEGIQICPICSKKYGLNPNDCTRPEIYEYILSLVKSEKEDKAFTVLLDRLMNDENCKK